MTGFVYFIRCQDRVKIGFSTQPSKRLTKVNADAPFPCELIGYVSAADFSEFRVHSEWFLAAPPLLAFVSEHSLSQPPGRDRFDRASIDGAPPLKRWRYAAKLSQTQAGARFGVGHVLWGRWESGAVRVPGRRVLDVERITGISRHELRPDVFGPAKSEGAAA